MVWALTKAPVADPVARLVLVGLANHAGPDGRGARPRQATLAEYVGVSTRTVRTKLRLLEDLGLIREGDQRTVAHLDANRRPVVWDLDTTQVRGAEDTSAQRLGGSTGTPGRKMATAWAEDGDTLGGNSLPTEPSMNLSTEPSRNRVDDSDAAPVREDVEAVCRIVADHVERVTDDRPRIGAQWRQQARLMLDRDGRTLEDVQAVMAWVSASSFWAANILSVPKLRAKWPTLVAHARRDAAQGRGGWVASELQRAADYAAGGGAR